MTSSLALLTLAAALAAPATPTPRKPTHTPKTVDLTPPSRRWIAATTSSECPRPRDAQDQLQRKPPVSSSLPDAWIVTSAFPRMGRVVGKNVPLPPSLRRFCIYTRAVPSADPPAFTVEAQQTISRIDPDYDVLVPQAPKIPGPVSVDPADDIPHTDIPQTPDEGRPDFDTPEKRAAKLHDVAAALFAETVGVTKESLGPSPIYTANSGPHEASCCWRSAARRKGSMAHAHMPPIRRFRSPAMRQ